MILDLGFTEKEVVHGRVERERALKPHKLEFKMPALGSLTCSITLDRSLHLHNVLGLHEVPEMGRMEGVATVLPPCSINSPLRKIVTLCLYIKVLTTSDDTYNLVNRDLPL